MMARKETVALAVDALRAHKLRSFLTLLGVIIGVASVIAVVSVIQGLNEYVSTQVMTFGSTSFQVTKFSQGFNTLDDFLRESKRKNLNTDDLQAIDDLCKHCTMTAGVYNHSTTLRRKGQSIENVDTRGVTVNAYLIGTVMELESGRHFTPADIDHARDEVIIGYDIKDQLFPGEDPIGKELTIDGRVFTVIAVAKKTGDSFGQSQDIFVRLPITSFKKLYNVTNQSLSIYVQTATPQEMRVAIDEARVIMRNRLHQGYKDADAFSIATADTFLDLWSKLTGSIFMVTIALASIALVVGGIVIMNIMLVSVTERTREIGIRKALGARRTDILGQFLAESVMLSGMGGVIGVSGGLFAAWLVSVFTPLPMTVRVWAIIVGVGVASAVGIFFGIYPARTASDLDPVEALRAE